MKDWIRKKEHIKAGRPKLLRDEEESMLMNFMSAARKSGAVVDGETMSILAREVTTLAGRGEEVTDETFTRHWVRNFRSGKTTIINNRQTLLNP